MIYTEEERQAIEDEADDHELDCGRRHALMASGIAFKCEKHGEIVCEICDPCTCNKNLLVVEEESDG